MTDQLFKQGLLDKDAKPEPVGDYLFAHKWRPIQGRKTAVWSIFIKAHSHYIGRVAWYGPWRRFCFVPRTDAPLSFDALCMRSLADFCDKAKAEHRKKK